MDELIDPLLDNGDLMDLCRSGDTKGVREMLSGPGRPDLDGEYRGNGIPLFTACNRGFFGIVELLIAKGANVNRAGAATTPLMIAIANNDVPMVSLLLRSGATVDFPANDGRTPMDEAIANRNPEVISLLNSAKCGILP